MMFWVVLVVVFSLLVAMYAHSRGRSGVTFFLISLLLSPLIGLIIAVFSGPNKALVEKRQIDSGGMKKCPYCAELVKAEAQVCKHCGKEISVKAVTETLGELSADEKLKLMGIASVNAFGRNGLTPLMEYAEKGDKGVVELLLAAGARKDETNMSGLTAAERARRAGHEELAGFIEKFQAA